MLKENLKIIESEKYLRSKILNMTKEYVEKFGNNNLEKSEVVNVSGKVIDHEEVCNIVESGLDMWLTAGRFNKEFETKLKKYIGIKYLLTCNSGSSANQIALSALCNQYMMGEKYIKKGSEVITCAVGFPTTVNPIIVNGLVPVFIDAELQTYNIDVDKIEKAISDKTKAIMIAHTLGNPFDLEKVKKLCEKYNLYLIEDCCDALGSNYNNSHVGTFGDIGTLSFYPAHHITMGEGGAIFTNSSKIKKSMESIRDWGRDCWCDTGCDNTCKKRFDLAQLKKLDNFIIARKNNYLYLKKILKDLDDYFQLPSHQNKADPSWFGFPLLIKKDSICRNTLIKYLEANHIKTRLIFAGNLMKQPYMKYQKFIKSGTYNNSDMIMNNGLWVGLYPGLTKEDLNNISYHLHYFINKVNR